MFLDNILNEGLFDKETEEEKLYKKVIKLNKNDHTRKHYDVKKVLKNNSDNFKNIIIKNLSSIKDFKLHDIYITDDEIRFDVEWAYDNSASNQYYNKTNNINFGGNKISIKEGHFYFIYQGNIFLFDNGDYYVDDNNAESYGTSITIEPIFLKEDSKYCKIDTISVINILKVKDVKFYYSTIGFVQFKIINKKSLEQCKKIIGSKYPCYGNKNAFYIINKNEL